MADRWTKEEEDCCLKLIEQGCSIVEICSVLVSRNREAVARWCSRHRIYVPIHRYNQKINYDNFTKLMSKPKEI